ncbi:MAG: ribonuclease P protein component [Melioribacteraceae bacterium]|nr:ribonuclease P protein component [Melioribacteraceae bacterium]RJP56838.1 MAG: ribonuclease P protein component [Ignavibacteriales bacterium]WKZ69837.1 MAG: ribonuclease P protein component [Melioribacteraceae bacterium]
MKNQGFSKSERIKRKNDFEKVYSFGTTVYSSDKKLKATYFFDKTNERGLIKAAFAVHKRAGKAVWRNRVKRLLRESFRLNKNLLYQALNLDQGNLLIVFSPNNFNERTEKTIHLKDIMPSFIELVGRIKVV